MKKTKRRFIHWIEYPELKRPHHLSIGSKAPWMNKIQIRVPLFIAKLLHNII